MTDRSGDDERIRNAFDDLRGDDVRQHATFAAVRARGGRPRVRLSESPVLRLAAAVVLIAGAATTYSIAVRRTPTFTVPSEVVALGAWRPETDVLLVSPRKLLQAPTGIRESMIDVDTLTRGVLR
ncbi:MAG: hypothetical protein ABIT20_13390 [Gemmatimonadaceae bacterium]